MAEINSGDSGSINELEETLKSLSKPVDLITDAIANMYQQAENLNNSFLQGRTRMNEMSDAVAKAASGVIILGGSISDVGKTMNEIAEGSRRNVLATEKQVSKLYAASEILGINSRTLVENFASVGVETSQIGTNLESSIAYIQSVGLNAKDVMTDVANNMALMNKFNFANGVQGLTKMAAQASMLRFDMQNTANFADKVMSPENAIEAAAGFQRLGISIGNLSDPFALMNQSINDPGALQDSIIKATKQYTEFDEKTKSFKINPQGILMLKEMADVTGISAAELSKTALAAADLDKRISNINPSISFDKPEDKELLANMATMGDDGEYIVKLKNDETGKIDDIKLSEITNDELKALRKQQAEAPKTLEDIQKSQLDVLKDIDASLKGAASKGSYGVAGSSIVRGNVVGAGNVIKAVTSSVDDAIPESSKVIGKVNNAVEVMKDLFVAKESKTMTADDFAKQIKSLEDVIISDANSFGANGIKALKDILSESSGKITGTSAIELGFKNFAQDILGATGKEKITSADKDLLQKTKDALEAKSSSSSVFGGRTAQDYSQLKETKNTGTQSTTSSGKVDVGGTITFKFDLPPGTTLNQQQLNAAFNSEEFKQYIVKLSESKVANKNQSVVSYGK
jgi:hypothetical protein